MIVSVVKSSTVPSALEKRIREIVRAMVADSSQRVVARRLGVTQPAISIFLANGGLGLPLLRGVAKHLGKTPEQLIAESEAPPRSLTPLPSSSVRISDPSIKVPSAPANRTRATQLLIGNGYSSELVETELALAAIDNGVAPNEDRSVAWWIDAFRMRLTRAKSQ